MDLTQEIDVMGDIKNRAPWAVICQSTGETLGTGVNEKAAKKIAASLRESGSECLVKQLEDGPFQARVRRAGFPTCTQTFEKQKDAKQWITLRESEVLRRELDDYREADRTTLSQMLIRYRDSLKKDELSDNSKWHRLTKIARDPVAGYRLSKLRPMHICEFRDRRLKQVKPASIVAELNLIAFVIALARREWGIAVPKNIATSEWVKRPKIGLEGERTRRLEVTAFADEEDKLFKALENCRNPVVTAFILLGLETGIRRGELLKLEWVNVNIELGYITLSALITKSKKPRQVPLTQRAIDALKTIEKIGNMVFEGETRDSIKCAFNRARKRAGIKNLRNHDLRHEFTSRLFENTDLRNAEIMLITGHSSEKMMWRYLHTRPSFLVERFRQSHLAVAEAKKSHQFLEDSSKN
jgi:integrase